MTKGKKKMSLLVKIAIGFVLGIVAGLIFKENTKYIAPVGDIFLRLLKMLILPLIFFAIVSGITNIPDIKSMYKIGVKSIGFFVVLTALAIIVGMLFSVVLKPGVDANITLPEAEVEDVDSITFMDTIENMIPTNVFDSLVEDNMLQVIFFALIFGICILILEDKANNIKLVIDEGANVMYKMTDLIISLAPIGVFGLIAGIIGEQGISTLLSLGKFLIIFHLAILFFVFVVQSILILVFGKMGPIKFYKEIFGAISMAFATDSSAAALPVAMKELQENLDVPENIVSFVMPVGTNISKSGSALYQGFAVVFVAQLVGMDLSFAHYVTVFLTALLASLGTAGVPSASIVMLSMTLSSIGLPLEAIGLLAGVDRILGGARTAPNVITNAAISKIVSEERK